MRKLLKKTLIVVAAGTMLLSASFPAARLHAQTDTRKAEEGSVAEQFMDCIEPMPIVEGLSTDCWGAKQVGPRDQGNGLEDRDMSDYSYWDGGIIKDEESGKYYMFASRWNQAGGHWGQDGISGWQGSQAIYAISDNLYGPYEDQGPIWPEWCDGAGHNVFPFKISEADPLYEEGYRYAISISDTGMHGETANGTLHISQSLDGPWELISNGHDGKLNAVGGNGFSLSNISIMVRPDGKYEATNRNGDIAIADSLAGIWEVKENSLWWKVPGMSSVNVEDPVIWYSDGLYHIVVNKWDTRMSYYLTSRDGITDWKRHPGTAYTPDADFLRYEDGTVNNWSKIERPNIYVEDNQIKALTFAVIDVQKEEDFGNDQHGSKIIVVPFSSEKLTKFDQEPDPLESRQGMMPIADTNSQSWEAEINKNYGAERRIQLQKDPNFKTLGKGELGEGDRPNSGYDCKIGYLKYDIADYQLSSGTDIESAYLSVVFLNKASGNSDRDNIQVVLADSDWVEGIGWESVNNNQADPGTLTWQNQPALEYEGGDLEGTMAISESFHLSDYNKEIKIDVTHLVSRFIEQHPGETTLSFALNETATGNRIQIGSRETGIQYAPLLMITVDKSSVQELLKEAEAYDKNLYSEKTWEAFTAALEEAKRVCEDRNAAKDTVDSAAKNLRAAIDGLVRTYVITLNFNDGITKPVYLTYEAGELLGGLQTPHRSGYTFKGWFDAMTGGQRVTAATRVSGNISYYAQWDKIADNGKTNDGNNETETPLVKGKTFRQGALWYKVTKPATLTKAGTVQVWKPTKKNCAKITIPATVKAGRYAFKVTAIGKSAFRNNKNLCRVVIGKNVENIYKKAFYNDKKLKRITIQSKKLKSVGAKALKGINRKAVIRVPSSKLKTYKNKILKGKGLNQTVKIKR